MRKLAFLFIFMGLFGTHYNAMAVGKGSCVPSECGYKKFVAVGAGTVAGSHVGSLLGIGGAIVGGVTGAKLGGKIQISEADEYIKLSDGRCFECDTCQFPPCNDCGDGKYVTNGNRVYRCSAGFNDKWQDYTSQIGFCIDSPIKQDNVKNALIEYHGDNFQSFAGQGVATFDTICIYAKCPDGKNPQNNECITTSQPTPTTNPDPAVAQRRAEQQRLANASREEKCKATGGTWASGKCTCSADKGLKNSGDECVCIDDTYEKNPDGKSCKLKDVEAQKQACAAAASSGAYWEDERCKCQDMDQIWRNNTCMENTEIARCKSAKGTKWNYNTNECVCKDSGYAYDRGNNECTETDDARKKREEAAELARQKAKQEESKANITSIAGKIKKLTSDLNISKWKNKDGNFNTSRLVSDSVAGVVLGTAGGLITSNVIKKNQIKGGFEDISCTISGQTVAGYGDEFQVGIQ